MRVYQSILYLKMYMCKCVCIVYLYVFLCMVMFIKCGNVKHIMWQNWSVSRNGNNEVMTWLLAWKTHSEKAKEDEK